MGQEIDPTPDEIRAACLRIQSTWTPRERMLRAVALTNRRERCGWRPPRWTPPTINLTPEVAAALEVR